ncbi:Toxin 1, PIN domain [Microbacterium esteraromaticum]|uniref:Ribonuclease VapC n=1 Tax=Microbacterium esteraromaticum TaxID=57043 RepID=A0A1R4KR33_9MICO|nr:TA system VapC family ribonuclease toxin [Microbacterium esteraromaticum]SJN46587.1 Toxin 1, PIN domain [Microbacterium esteraromaticum]
MTLFVPDADVLVRAFRADSPDHERCAAWLNGGLQTDRIGLADTILADFVRIATHPRVFTEPAPTAAALTFARHLIDAPRSEWLRQGSAPWDELERLAGSDAGIRGDLVADARIAALCLTNGATLATRDRGFGRFPGLKRVDPAAARAD